MGTDRYTDWRTTCKNPRLRWAGCTITHVENRGTERNMPSLYNQAYKLQEQRDFDGAMRLFKQALEGTSSAMDRMVTTYAMANCVWESAGLELEGRVHSLIPGNLVA